MVRSAEGARPVRRLVVAVALVLAFVLVAGAALVAGLRRLVARRGDAGGPTPVTPVGRCRRRPSPPVAGAGVVLRPDARLVRLPRRRPVRDAHRAARLPPTPSAHTIELALLKVPAADPASRIGSLVVNPGGPGEPGTSYAALGRAGRSASRCSTTSTSSASTRAAPATAPRSTASATPTLDAYLAADPEPVDAGRGRVAARHAAPAGDRAAADCPVRWPPTSRPSSRPATWTSCGPRWARGP